jgi:hypothetical protein
MMRETDSMDSLTGDLRNLSELVSTITDLALDIIGPEKTQCEQTREEVSRVVALLWIARDMAEIVAENGETCHRRIIADMKTARKEAA